MIVSIIFLIISIFLDGIVGMYVSWFVPIFTLTTLIYIYPLYQKDPRKYFGLFLFFGIWYDIVYSPILCFYTSLFLITTGITRLIYQYQRKTLLLVVMLSFVSTIVFRGIYGVLFYLQSQSSFPIQLFFKDCLYQCSWMILYGFLLYVCFQKQYRKDATWF